MLCKTGSHLLRIKEISDGRIQVTHNIGYKKLTAKQWAESLNSKHFVKSDELIRWIKCLRKTKKYGKVGWCELTIEIGQSPCAETLTDSCLN